MPFGLGDGLASNHNWRIGVILALNYLGRVVTSWDFTNKMGFWRLIQLFYFICKMTLWDD
jgi:hypothetical protein